MTFKKGKKHSRKLKEKIAHSKRQKKLKISVPQVLRDNESLVEERKK